MRILPASAWRGLLEGFDQDQSMGCVTIRPGKDATIDHRAGPWGTATGRQAEMMFSRTR